MKKLLTLLLFAFLASVLAAMVALVLPSYKKQQDMIAHHETLKKDLRDKNNKRLELKKRFYDLQNSPEAVEQVAREKFNYAKPEETVFKQEGKAKEERRTKE